MTAHSNLTKRLTDLFDTFHQRLSAFEREANAAGPGILDDARFYRQLRDDSHLLAEQLLGLLDEHGGEAVWPIATRALQSHPLHQNHLLQSDFISHAFRKPNGYAGDKDLMIMICDNAHRGNSAYAMLKNQVYQDLPAAEAVRQRIRSLRGRLGNLPDNAYVLNLACGPAIEVQDYLKEHPTKAVHFDLLDHDIHTTRYTSRNIRGSRVRHLIGNAFQIVKGDYRAVSPRPLLWSHCSPKDDFKARSGQWKIPLKYRRFELQCDHYDLVYSAGLYDYIDDFPDNPERGARALTRRLYDLLKPHGTLIIGNFLAQGQANPHKKAHRLMMEIYSEWKLLYRTKLEIESFLSTLPQGEFEYQYTNERFEDSQAQPSTIGFLHITRAK